MNASDPPSPLLRHTGDALHLPPLASVHSHAFQRALRGRTQQQRGTFWSWREQMYRLADQLTPEQLYAISHYAFVELALAGVGVVGEFHYLHHQPGGRPYERRTVLAEQVIQAALDAGLRIGLLRTAYLRGDFDDDPAPAQRRFIDPDPDAVIRDVEALRDAYAGNPRVRVGLALHSVRAVPVEALAELSDYAEREGLMVHMHVAEQPREVEACLAATGYRPVQLLTAHNLLHSRFVAVHATHLAPEEIDALGQARAFVCLCRTTERDLGDGLPPAGPLLRAGARLCAGTDSHAAPDPWEELRAVELDERSRTLRRHAAADGAALLAGGTAHGYAALGWDHIPEGDELVLDGTDPALVGADPARLADGVVFGATARAVRGMRVGDRPVISHGAHPGLPAARKAYLEVLRELDF
jgi:formiminoglutamate deiminase